MEESLRERCLKYSRHFSGLCGISCSVIDMSLHCFLESPEDPPVFCAHCSSYNQMRLSTHCYGCSEAYRWNGRYVYYCPLGLAFVASSVSDDRGELAGGLIAGPVIMGNYQDTLQELPCKEMASEISNLPVVTPRQMTDLSEILAAVTFSISGIPHSKAGSFVYEQERLLNSIYDVKEKYVTSGGETTYPIESEKKLQALIRGRDKAGSRELLNQLLGEIFFFSNFNLEEIKARVLELLVLISRASIDAGADVQEIFGFNNEYLQKIESFQSIDELSVWLTGIMHRFIDYTFDFSRIKHIDAVYKTMEYVRANYDKKLSLDEIAKNAFLSKAYLSSIFKEEIGESLTNYINRVRIEKSRVLLLDKEISLIDIANLCGFEDQSYFTRVFKKIVGISPKKYRDSRGAAVTPVKLGEK
ncbi:MAG TPA: AraC family transcriptional regulator [Candidatus Merdivicinus excrementipullorum]|uniref:AraC family transcriptional regulator n=1 Tax=Candidatus Merdivicinus excrementipullorum TaxID=2840867 RepID=A0A9D1FLG8_9FIRM|nr:AraC family transcriptional regulator [Candidatus Merdivicinus excrementipullorum]